MNQIKTFFTVVLAMTVVLVGYEWYQRSQAVEVKSAAFLAEGFAIASPARTAVMHYFNRHGELPSSNAELGLPDPADIRATALTSVEVSEGGIITMTFNEKTGYDEGRVLLIPNADNHVLGVRWQCETPDYEDIAIRAPQCRYVDSDSAARLTARGNE